MQDSLCWKGGERHKAGGEEEEEMRNLSYAIEFIIHNLSHSILVLN